MCVWLIELMGRSCSKKALLLKILSKLCILKIGTKHQNQMATIEADNNHMHKWTACFMQYLLKKGSFTATDMHRRKFPFWKGQRPKAWIIQAFY